MEGTLTVVAHFALAQEIGACGTAADAQCIAVATVVLASSRAIRLERVRK